MKRAVIVLALGLSTGVFVRSLAVADEMDELAAPAAAAAAKPASLWNYFGIPQGSQKVRDARLNRRGNNPQRERVDPLKRIADPENLKSDNPAIKTAAEAKAEADLAPQKIKAIKFLATVCCCCSKYKAEVKNALLAALSDCTEEVRYQAAVALCQCSGDPCTICNRCSCCDPDIMGRLAELADGKAPNGCYLESSPRVRAAARNALKGCEEVFRPTGQGPGPTPAKPEGPVERRQTATDSDGSGQASVSDIKANLASFDEVRAAVSVFDPSDKDVPDTGLAEVGDNPELFPRGTIRAVGGDFGLVSYQPVPVAPTLQPPPVELPMPELPTPTPAVDLTAPSFGGLSVAQALESVLRAPGPADAMSGADTATKVTPDLADALRDSNSIQSVEVQRRSPVALDPHIRGYKFGQIYAQADGVFWTPARLDLDTMLNKIDPSMIQSVTVVPGPYGLRYGPGLAFIDVQRVPTPRYDTFQSDFDSTLSTRTNGGQINGRETVTAGGPDYGLRASYGIRKGSDYLAGNALKIPSTYLTQDIWTEFSYDLNPNQRLDVNFMRLDQGYTEYPCQFFNINDLATYGFNARVTDTDPSAPWAKMNLETWYNTTRFDGSTANKRLAHFPELQRVDFALFREFNGVAPTVPIPNVISGVTDGNLFNTGARAGLVLGDPDESHVNVGTDFRYLGQRINEHFTVDTTFLPGFGDPAFHTNMPRAWSMDPGAYAEWSNPITDTWTAIVGARADFVWTRARFGDVNPDGILASEIASAKDLDQYDTLYSFYYTNKWKLNEHWDLTGGFGHGQRPPTLTERYADGLFLSLAQSGYTRMVGNPFLKPERDWQADVGLTVQHEDWRAGARGFYAWVIDYVTFADEAVGGFADARLLNFFNTPLATLVGVEVNAEYDLNSRWTAFAGMNYREGRDQTIHEPLPSIPPMDSIFGIRLHDSEKGKRWGVEFAARVVNTQNLLGTIRTGGATELTTIEERTPGFTVYNIRGYWNARKNLTFIAGIDNLLDKAYQEHLDLRLLGPGEDPPGAGNSFADVTGQGPTRVWSPGFTPYAGINWVF
jgi:outer membrane receptor protein involved in Fe transport